MRGERERARRILTDDTRDEVVDKLNRLAEGGVEYVLLNTASATQETLQEFVEDIKPHVALPRSGRAARTAPVHAGSSLSN